MSTDDPIPQKAKKRKSKQKSESNEKGTKCMKEKTLPDSSINISAESVEIVDRVDSRSENGKDKKMKGSKKRKSLDTSEVVKGDNVESTEIDNTQTPVKKKKRKLPLDEEKVEAAEESVGNPGNDAETNRSPKGKKKKKKKLKEQDNEQSTPDPEQKGDRLASEYLKQWSNERKTWKFQKVRQVWLLKHMYIQDQVSDDDFEILLLYLDGLKGKSREVTVKQAEDIMEMDEDNEGTDVKTERARKIVQLLS